MTSTMVRRATEEDVPALTKIRKDAHAKKLAYQDYAWGKEGDVFSERWTRDRIAAKDVYVVELDGTPTATFSLDLDDEQRWGRQGPVAVYVHGLCVRDGFNGRGLGALMLDWCGAKARALNRGYVRLDCPAQNVTLCAWYESLGFVRTGVWQEPGPGGYVWSLYQKLAGSHDSGINDQETR